MTGRRIALSGASRNSAGKQPPRHWITFGYLLLCLVLLTAGEWLPAPGWHWLIHSAREWRLFTLLFSQAGLFTGIAVLLQREFRTFWPALLGVLLVQVSRFLTLDDGVLEWPVLLVRLVGFSFAAPTLWRGLLVSQPEGGPTSPCG